MPLASAVVRDSAKRGTLPVEFRPYDDQDMNFIINSHMKNYWTHGLRATGRKGGLPVDLIDHEAYAVNQKALLLNWVSSGEVIMAVSPADPWFLFGYLVGELDGPAPLVHYVLVKHDYRRQGIAGMMLKEMVKRHGTARRLVFTHWTERGGPALADWLRRQGVDPVWNPYLAR